MPPELRSILKGTGFSDKEIAVYSHLLPLGYSSVRDLAEKTGVNRGSVHDALGVLVERGLVHKEKVGKQVRFIADSPKKLVAFLEKKQKELFRQTENLQENMGALLSFYAKQGGRPSVEYFDDDNGIKAILEDVLNSVGRSKEKVYYVYSSRPVRKYLYALFPHFTKEKTKHGIKTRVIALGEGGDPKQLKLSERRWINKDAPAYVLIYANKLALVSTSEDKQPFGVLIRDDKIYETQKIIFEQLWSKIERNPPKADAQKL